MQTEKLYIGNATRQSREFQYRADKGAPLRSQTIPPGTQIQVSGDLTPAQVDYIIRMEAKYGIVAAENIDQTKGFVGTCYSIGKPIAGMRLTLLMDHNIGQLVILGAEIRKASAVAQNTLIEQTLQESGRPERLTEMDLTIQQENQDPGNKVPQLSEGFRIVRSDGSQTPVTPRRSGRRRAA